MPQRAGVPLYTPLPGSAAGQGSSSLRCDTPLLRGLWDTWVCSSQNQCHRTRSPLSPPHSPNLQPHQKSPLDPPLSAHLALCCPGAAEHSPPAPAKPLSGHTVSTPCISHSAHPNRHHSFFCTTALGLLPILHSFFPISQPFPYLKLSVVPPTHTHPLASSSG